VNRWASKDPDGKPWIQDWTKLVKEKGSGWIEYKELNPAQANKVMKKASFVELLQRHGHRGRHLRVGDWRLRKTGAWRPPFFVMEKTSFCSRSSSF
jgi:hypothetical protein